MNYIQKSRLEMATFLQVKFLDKNNLGQNFLANAIGVPNNRISEIMTAKRSITADTDLRLAKYFSLEGGYFLQKQAELQIKAANIEMKDKLKFINPKPIL